MGSKDNKQPPKPGQILGSGVWIDDDGVIHVNGDVPGQMWYAHGNYGIQPGMPDEITMYSAEPAPLKDQVKAPIARKPRGGKSK